jgi:phosphofructokinase-like protein
MAEIRKIAINTGGGDAPGLNAVIRAVVMAGTQHGWECWGIRDGYNGLLEPEAYPEGGLIKLSRIAVTGIGHLGGTILGTTNRGNPLHYPRPRADGSEAEEDRCDELVESFRSQGFDALVAVGGDGSLEIAHALAQKGLRVICVPKTIDNDLERTFMTFGFDSAVSFATECLDRLHTTARSHRRIMVVEVMGRYAGWIALHAGMAGNAHVVLIPEIPYDLGVVAELVKAREARGRHYTLVVAAEGAKPVGGGYSYQEGERHRLGGLGVKAAEELEDLTGKEARCVVLGHLLRGGPPTSFDRLVALRFGAAAVRALHEGQSAVMVSLAPPTVRYEPLGEVVRRMKTVPLDSDTVRTARDIGISFGER